MMKFLYGMLFMILLHSSGILTIDSIVSFAKPELNAIFSDLAEATN